jgi:hypothetical protein
MAKVWIKVCNAKSEGQAKASNTTDLDGGHLSPHLISICQIFRDILKLTSIAETFISGFSEITTICGSAISNAEVWIKVCNTNFDHYRSPFTYIITTGGIKRIT